MERRKCRGGDVQRVELGHHCRALEEAGQDADMVCASSRGSEPRVLPVGRWTCRRARGRAQAGSGTCSAPTLGTRRRPAQRRPLATGVDRPKSDEDSPREGFSCLRRPDGREARSPDARTCPASSLSGHPEQQRPYGDHPGGSPSGHGAARKGFCRFPKRGPGALRRQRQQRGERLGGKAAAAQATTVSAPTLCLEAFRGPNAWQQESSRRLWT